MVDVMKVDPTLHTINLKKWRTLNSIGHFAAPYSTQRNKQNKRGGKNKLTVKLKSRQVLQKCINDDSRIYNGSKYVHVIVSGFTRQ